MNFLPSKATKSDISIYTEGSCHDFACAMHKHTGWPLLLVYEKAEPSIRNGADEILHRVMHVACLDPDGNAWDVTGCVHRSKAARHYRKYMHFDRIGFDLMATPRELERYIGFGPYQTLGHQYDTTLEWADRDARRVLREFGILPPPDEFTDVHPRDAGGVFEEDYGSGIASLNAAIGIASHFGYPVATAFGTDRKIIKAWAEDHRGRPVTASGLLRDHSELDLPEGCSVRIWEVPHHAMADGRLRSVLGSEALNCGSVSEAFREAQQAFPSIRDTKLADGRWVSSYTLSGSVRNLLDDAAYDDEFGELKELAKKGKPHKAAMAAVSDPSPVR
jgi:hypothetical protein